MSYTVGKKFVAKPDWGMVSRTASVSRDTDKTLRKISEDLKVPMSTLIGRAIKNELLCQNPFEFRVQFPDPSDIPEDVSKTLESVKLFDFIKKYPGLNIEQLLFSKHDIGIDTEPALLLAYVLLLKVNVIIEYKPVRAKFAHPPGYRVVKINELQKVVKHNVSRHLKKLEYQERGPLNEADED